MFQRNQVYISLCAYIGQVIVGISMGWPLPVLAKLMDISSTPLAEVISNEEGFYLTSAICFGCVLGPFFSGFLSNKFGRKACLYIGGGFSIVSFFLLAISKKFIMIFVGRILQGFAIGFIYLINYIYIGEIASTEVRGIFLSCTGIFETFGILIAYTVMPFVSYVAGHYIGIIISILFVLMLIVIPESPLFLIMKGKNEEAQEVLKLIGREEDAAELANRDPQPQQTLTYQYTEIFTVKSNRRALLITLCLCVLQHTSGALGVTYYSTQIFMLAGFAEFDTRYSLITIGVIRNISSFITPFFIERTGRRSLMLVSTASCFISLALLGTYFVITSADKLPLLRVVPYMPLSLLINYFVSYTIGIGIIPAVFIGELFTANVRSTAGAIAVTTGWGVGFCITGTLFFIVRLGPQGVFWIFSIGCALALIFTVAFVPETKRQTLEEIQKSLSK